MQFTYTPPTAPTQEPIIEVWIAGMLQRKVKLTRLTDTAGLEPAHVTLIFPLSDYLAHPCADDDRILVYINRTYRPEPLFRGFVTGFGDYITLASGQYIQVYGLDDVRILNCMCCERDYNVRDARDAYSERLTIRQIAADLSRQATARFGSEAPAFATSTFPNSFPGEVKLLGTPLDQALSQLIELTDSQFKYLIRRSYSANRTSISCFKIGQGEVAEIVYGTDNTKGPRNQPFGVAQVRELRNEENFVDVVNAGYIVGDRILLETALPLARSWPADKESYLDNIKAYSEKGPDDTLNPLYDPEAERIGRAWRFAPQYTGSPGLENAGGTGMLEYPEIEPRLIVDNHFSNQGTDIDLAKPFVVYQFSGEATYNVTFQISLNDNEVRTDKPLVKENTGDGAVTNPELPEFAWLECAFKLREKFTTALSKTGSVNRRIERHFQKEDYKYKYQSAYFTVAKTTTGNDYGSIERYTAAYTAGNHVIRNDTATAQTWGIAKLRTLRESKIERTFELPRMDLNLRVGQTIKENGQITDLSIFSVEIDPTAHLTTITAVNR